MKQMSLAFFLLGVAATADAFQFHTMTSSSPLQRILLPKRAPASATVAPSQQPWQQYSYSGVTSMLYSESETSSETIDDSGGGETKLQKKIAARKKRVDIGYQTAALAYALVACVSFVKYRFYEPIPIPSMLSITAGPWMASSVARHLVGSGSDDSLNTGASKRLNLALASFGFIGLLSKDIVTTARPLWIFACLITMINSIKGYGYGLKGWDLKMMDGNAGAAKDILGGAVASLRSVFALPAIFSRSAGYAAMVVTFGAMKCATMYKLILHMVAVADGGPMNKMVLLPLAFQCKKLLLLTVAALTLKDAVDAMSPKGWGAAPVGLGLATAVATGAIAAQSIAQGSLNLGRWIAFLAVFSAVDGVNRWTSINFPLKVTKTSNQNHA